MTGSRGGEPFPSASAADGVMLSVDVADVDVVGGRGLIAAVHCAASVAGASHAGETTPLLAVRTCTVRGAWMRDEHALLAHLLCK